MIENVFLFGCAIPSVLLLNSKCPEWFPKFSFFILFAICGTSPTESLFHYGIVELAGEWKCFTPVQLILTSGSRTGQGSGSGGRRIRGQTEYKSAVKVGPRDKAAH